jgi:hypothetical protein
MVTPLQVDALSRIESLPNGLFARDCREIKSPSRHKAGVYLAFFGCNKKAFCAIQITGSPSGRSKIRRGSPSYFRMLMICIRNYGHRSGRLGLRMLMICIRNYGHRSGRLGLRMLMICIRNYGHRSGRLGLRMLMICIRNYGHRRSGRRGLPRSLPPWFLPCSLQRPPVSCPQAC